MSVTDHDVVLFSGGLDSAVTAYKLRERNPTLLFIDTGCRDIAPSYPAAKRCAAYLGLPLMLANAKFLIRSVSDNELHIPRRNMMFGMIAATYGNHIYLGGIKGDNCIDKSPDMMSLMLCAINVSSSEKVKAFDSILWGYDKTDLIEYLIEEEAEPLLTLTRSCYSNSNSHCGNCTACIRRWAAYSHYEVKTDFVNDPATSHAATVYRNRILSGVYRENVPENIMRSMLGLPLIEGGDEVPAF